MAADKVKPLTSYPEVDRLWLGMEEGSVRPSSYAQQKAAGEGFLRIQAKDGQQLKEGECWAVMDPEQLEIEIKALELDEQKLVQQRRQLTIDSWDAEARLTMELSEMMDKKTALEDASKDLNLPARLRGQATKAIARLERQIALQKERLDPETLKRELQLEFDASELAIARKRKQLEVLKRRSYMVAEFAGELRLSDRIKDALGKLKEGEEARVWVDANEHLAVIEDASRYEITVASSGPVMGSVPAKQLLVFLQQSQTGRLIGGEYTRTEEVDSGLEIKLNYIFNIKEGALEDAMRSMGQRNLVHVYCRFNRPYRLVHKKDIAFAAPEVLANSGWAGLVRHLWPGSEVAQVGPQAIAIKAKDEN